MDARSTTVSLEVELPDGDHPRGRARNGAGSWRSFSGWLGLLDALDALFAEASGPQTPDASPDGGAPNKEDLR